MKLPEKEHGYMYRGLRVFTCTDWHCMKDILIEILWGTTCSEEYGRPSHNVHPTHVDVDAADHIVACCGKGMNAIVHHCLTPPQNNALGVLDWKHPVNLEQKRFAAGFHTNVLGMLKMKMVTVEVHVSFQMNQCPQPVSRYSLSRTLLHGRSSGLTAMPKRSRPCAVELHGGELPTTMRLPKVFDETCRLAGLVVTPSQSVGCLLQSQRQQSHEQYQKWKMSRSLCRVERDVCGAYRALTRAEPLVVLSQ